MTQPLQQTEPLGFGSRLGRHLKKSLGAGLLVVIPLGITIFILSFLFNLGDGFLAPLIKHLVGRFFEEVPYIPGLGMISAVLVVYLAGVLVANVLGQRLVAYGDQWLSRIPLVKSIYTSSKQLTSVLSKGGKSSFRQAVYIEFPREGCYTIGFISSSVAAASGKAYYMVFVPTSPNPTSGYVLLLEQDKVYPAAFGVEEAMKIIMSGGMVAPDLIRSERLQ